MKMHSANCRDNIICINHVTAYSSFLKQIHYGINEKDISLFAARFCIVRLRVLCICTDKKWSIPYFFGPFSFYFGTEVFEQYFKS